MRRSWQALLSMAILAAGVAAAAFAAGPARVTVTDSSLSPSSVSIAVGGKVTWTNAGKQAHVVFSLSATFPTLVVQPGRSKSVTFKVKRCERYSVDGKRNGRVVVGGAACGAGTTPPPPPSGGTGTVTRHYDVRVDGYFEEIRKWTEGDPEQLGVETTTLTWRGTWKRVALKITAYPNGFGFLAQLQGRIVGWVRFVGRIPARTCSGDQAVTSSARLNLIGSRAPSGASSFALQTYLASPRFLKLNFCPLSAEYLLYNQEEAPVSGLRVRISDNDMAILAERNGRGTFFPLDRIRSGDSVTIATGQRAKTQTLPDGSKNFRWRATIKLTPIR